MPPEPTTHGPDYGSFNERGEHDGGDDAERARSVEEFQRRDRNGDGGLTAEEYVGAAHGAQVPRRLADFLKADVDGDGEITLAEWHRLRGTAHAGDQLLELADLIHKVAPAVGNTLRQILAGLGSAALARVAADLDMAATAEAAQEARVAAIVRAVREALAEELAGRADEAAQIDGWLATHG